MLVKPLSLINFCKLSITALYSDLLYALYEGDYGRSTYDIDLLAYHISDEKNNMEDIFKKIFSIELDDGLIYDLKSIKVKEITKFKEYHGVNVSIICYLGNICIPISLDIGFGIIQLFFLTIFGK